MVSPNSKDLLNLMVCTSTEMNRVVVHQKCVHFNVLFTVEIYGEYVTE